jgi:hypothetical protein
MEAFEKNILALKKLRMVFLILGCIECLVYIIVADSFWGMILGVITILLAYFMNNEKKLGYYLSGWTFLKYNPMYIITMIRILGDSSKMPGLNLKHSTIAYSIECLSFLIMILSIIFGIILLIKTIQYFRLKKMTSIIESKQE